MAVRTGQDVVLSVGRHERYPRHDIEAADDPTMDIVLVEASGPNWPTKALDGWNNAGTGPRRLLRAETTPPRTDGGDVVIDRALQINAQFEVTLQFWSLLGLEQGILPDPKKIHKTVPASELRLGRKKRCLP